MKNPEQNQLQIIGTESLEGSVETSSAEQTTQASEAPLYSSPWLAFFYIIKQGWGEPRP